MALLFELPILDVCRKYQKYGTAINQLASSRIISVSLAHVPDSTKMSKVQKCGCVNPVDNFTAYVVSLPLNRRKGQLIN